MFNHNQMEVSPKIQEVLDSPFINTLAFIVERYASINDEDVGQICEIKVYQFMMNNMPIIGVCFQNNSQFIKLEFRQDEIILPYSEMVVEASKRHDGSIVLCFRGEELW